MKSISHRHIDVFRELMRGGSVTAAAAALHTSQPTVSRELARLESLLGLALFDRVRGRLKPTAQALTLFDEVQRSYVGLDRIAATAEQLRRFSQGQLSVVCLPAFSVSLLPGACARFARRHADVGIAITPQESPFLEQWLGTQSVDLGLTEQAESPSGTRRELLWSANEVVVLPADHPLTARSVIRLDDLAGQRFVNLAPHDPYRRQLDALCAAQGIARRPSVDTHSADSVCAMVASGLGLAVVNPLTALRHASRALVVRQLAVDIPFHVSLIRPEHRPRDARADALAVALREEAAAITEELRRLAPATG